MQELPIEIWQTIFRWVSQVDGALEVSLTTHVQWLQWRYDEDQLYRDALLAKCSLVLTCKAWYELAGELLYQDIRISSLKNVEQLHRTLMELASRGRMFGWWTKRLDLTPNSRVESADFFQLFPDIATHLPNLLILTIHDLNMKPPQLDVSAFPKLRSASVRSDEYHPLYFPQLDSLVLLLTCGNYHTYMNVTILEIYFHCIDPAVLLRYSFPNLRYLGLRHYHNTSMELEATFFGYHGPRLLSLDILQERNVDRINTILSYTPNVKELILDSHVTWDGLNEYQSVTHLGLFHAQGVVNLVDLTLSKFPRLRFIQMIEAAIADLLPPGDKHCVLLSCPQIAERVKIEDVYGMEMPWQMFNPKAVGEGGE